MNDSEMKSGALRSVMTKDIMEKRSVGKGVTKNPMPKMKKKPCGKKKK